MAVSLSQGHRTDICLARDAAVAAASHPDVGELCDRLSLAGGQVPIKAALSRPCSAEERKYNKRLTGRNKVREVTH